MKRSASLPLLAILSFSIASIPICWAQLNLKTWDGPISGPKAVVPKTVVFLASDFGNGGVSAYFRGFESALNAIGWRLSSVIDGEGVIETLKQGFTAALAARPDAIVLAGFQPEEFQPLADKAHQLAIILVGWHAAANPGPTKNLFVNIATDTGVVAKMAADFVIEQSNGKAGVVIFNDARFAVANAKTNIMKNIIIHSKFCKLLSVENIAISNAALEIPKAVVRLNEKFGKSWTHTLAINDIYFDNMNFPLANIGRKDIVNISAGDGSNLAISRIKSNISQQIATIAEPLTIQGWQSIDELNRAFSGLPPSGYIGKPLLFTASTLQNPAIQRDEEIAAMKAYIAIWKNQ